MAKKYNRKTNHKYLKDIIEKRYILLSIIICIFFVIIISNLFYLQIIEKNTYSEKLKNAVSKKILSTSTPRGRIYDRNHNLIVDNEAIKTIYYKKEKGITLKEEIELAYKVADLIDIDQTKLTIDMLKDFWLKQHPEEGNQKITKEELNKLEERKLTNENIKDLKLARITEEELKEYQDGDLEVAYLYYLMNKGYSYAEKTIKNTDVTEEEYAKISEHTNTLRGFNTKLDWKRVYLYGDTFKSILGTVSSESQGIPAELVETYQKKGYSLNDRVGISYLEYQYEDYLKGEKAEYRLLSDNSYELITTGARGKDLVLTIDIKLQQEVEQILSEEVLNTKKESATDYYNRSFAIITDPNTGEIYAMSGKQVLTDEKGNNYIVDYTPGVVTLPVTPGSVVKGASMSVGYKYNAIDIGTVMKDECIKIKDTNEKCSWKNLGTINDISALAYSSNSYQFKIAIKVGGGTYKYNSPLSVKKGAFEQYRNMYAEYGLGVKTNIDLPVESLGYVGQSTKSGHLLDFAIGQYDTYTPIQLSVYINTIANGGNRYTPHLLKEVYEPNDNEEKFGKLIYKYENKSVGHISLEEKYIKRIQEGFHAVMSALGYGYMGNYSNSAGKTGTSQSFVDTNNDNMIDTETITNTFVGYAPYDNPIMSIVTVSPDISIPNRHNSGVNKRISAKITNKFFEIFK